MRRRRWPTRGNSGYRSGFEKRVAEQLEEAGVSFGYETERLAYVIPARKTTYTPDFFLPNGIIIESKGWPFEANDRQKLLLVKEAHPDRDIRLLFENSSRPIYKGSKTTFAKWANTHGFTWAEKQVPISWLNETQENN